MASAKPLPPDPEDDLMFRDPRKSQKMPRMTSTVPALRGAGEVAPLPRTRAPAGTQQGPVIAAAQSIRMATAPGGAPTIPPLPRTQASPPPVRTEMPTNIPIAAPFDAMPPTPRPQADVTWVGSRPRKARSTSMALKIGIPAVAMIAIGASIGAYIAFDGDRGGKQAANVVVEKTASKIVPAPLSQPEAKVDSVALVDEPVAADPLPAPAPATEAAPLPTPAGQPAFIDVRIDSKPAGATVMIVDRGKTAFLGTTPLRTAVDPARQYDLVFTYANKPTQLEHLDPSSTQHIEVVLGKPGAKSVAPVAPVAPVGVARVEPAAEAPKPERAIHRERTSPVRIARREPKPEVTMPETKSVARVTSKVPAFDPSPAPEAPAATPEPAVEQPVKKSKADLRAEREAEQEAARLAKKAQLEEARLAKQAALDAKKAQLEETRLARKQELEAKKAAAEEARLAKKRDAEAKKQELENRKAEQEAARIAKQAKGTFDGMLEKPAKGSKKAAKDKSVAEAPAEGFISVAAKPPCEILIDGKSTGLTSPQRSIAVPLGKHKVTLVNADIGVKKTLTVHVTAGEPAKVIQDFTK